MSHNTRFKRELLIFYLDKYLQKKNLKMNVNAGPKLHRTPERKCTIWLDLAGVKLRQLVGFRFVHGPARRSAPTKQRSCAGLWSNRGAVFALQALRDCRLCLRR